MEKRIHKHETPIFWIITFVALVSMVIAIGLFFWFIYYGHEPLPH